VSKASNGKRVRRLLIIAFAVCRTVNGQSADSIPSPSPPPYKQLRYDEDYRYLRDPARRTELLDSVKCIPFDRDADWWLTLGGEVRLRYEYFENPQWGAAPQDKDGYLLQRYMLHGDVHYQDAFRLFTQFKSGLIEDRAGGPRPTDQDDFDLHQLFADGRFAWNDRESFTLRVGRQEMSYGSSRLISVRESPNVRLSFDGVKAILQFDSWRVDAFATRPVETKPGVFDDGPDPHQKFWGVYGVTPLGFLPGWNADLYYLGIERDQATFDQGTARELRHSLGTRLWGRHGMLDWNFEFVYQFGEFGQGAISAWTAASDTGVTFSNAMFSPRLSLKANIASGDSNPNKADLNTFNALFPRGAYFNEMSLIGPANFMDLHPAVELQLTKKLTLATDVDFFWRESTRDGIYGNAVNLVRSGTGADARYVGSAAGAFVEWRAQRHLSLRLDYGHFFAGDFLKQTTPGKDVDYFSAWLTFRF